VRRSTEHIFRALRAGAHGYVLLPVIGRCLLNIIWARGLRTSRATVRDQKSDEFIAITSHDLRAPMRAVVSLAQWVPGDHHGVDAKVDFQ
jgi:hypothetical protein